MKAHSILLFIGKMSFATCSRKTTGFLLFIAELGGQAPPHDDGHVKACNFVYAHNLKAYANQ